MESLNQITTLPNRMRGVFYGWWLVILSGFTLGIAISPVFQGMTVWAVALERHFGWTRTQLGLALAFSRAEGGLMGPVEGFLTDKLGTRLMVLIGLLVLSGGFFLFGQIRNLWMFYVAYIVMSTGNGLGSFLPLMTMLNHWFSRHRTLAMGLAGIGVHVGTLILVPLIAWAIDPDQDRLGWRLTAYICGGLVLVIVLPLSMLMRNRPSDYGLCPDGDVPDFSQTLELPGSPSTSEKASPNAHNRDFTTAQALRTSAFWYIAIGHGLAAGVVVAIFGHLGLTLQDKGMSIQTTGWIVAIYSGVAMIFQIVGGFAGDIMPKKLALSAFTAIQALSLVILAISSSLPLMILFAVLIGIGFGGRNPLTTAIRGEYFGTASYGTILGISLVPMNALMLLSSPFAGFMRDTQGSYDTAYLVLAALCLVGSILFLIAKKPEIKGT